MDVHDAECHELGNAGAFRVLSEVLTVVCLVAAATSINKYSGVIVLLQICPHI